MKIDIFGVILSAIAIILITFGVNNIRTWGILVARSAAPFDVLGMSPAPIMIVVGLAIGMTFLLWTQRQAAIGKTPLLALEVVTSAKEWAAVVALFAVVSMEGAINFTVPLYIQFVQGSSSIVTSVAMMPFMLTVFFTAILIVRIYDRFSPRTIASVAFVFVSVGTAWLAFVVRNDWSALPVIAGLVTVGLGQGALVTLLFNVLVTSAPKTMAGDVGSLRGVTQNLAAAVGTATAGALLVGLLTSLVIAGAAENRVITAELKDEVNISNMNFFSDLQLKERLAGTSATADELAEALAINAAARTQAIKIGFLILSGLALLAIFPCRWLPDYRPGDLAPKRAENENE